LYTRTRRNAKREVRKRSRRHKNEKKLQKSLFWLLKMKKKGGGLFVKKPKSANLNRAGKGE
jgi:hypothetical protein